MPDFRVGTLRGLRGDLVRDGARFAEDGGLESAVALSLFCDRRLDEDTPPSDGTEDRRGYWGDQLSRIDGDEYGSLLHALKREKLTPEMPARARQHMVNALQWLIDDAVASEVRVTVEIAGTERLDVLIEIDELRGETQRFAFPWSLIEGVVAGQEDEIVAAG